MTAGRGLEGDRYAVPISERTVLREALKIRIEVEDFVQIEPHIINACLGGVSRVRRGDRLDALTEDQTVGQLGEFALCRWLNNEAFYFERRKLIDKHPHVGDGGADYPGRIDIKTSLMRASRNPWDYRLPVRPAERHPGNTYVLGLVETIVPPLDVHLMGWVSDTDLDNPMIAGPISTSGTFNGAWVVSATRLRDIRTLNLP